MRRGTLIGRIAAGLGALALVASACSGNSGPKVASLGGSTTTAPTGHSGSGGMLAFSKCMRTHGVPNFPEPNSQGQISINASPGSGLDPQSPQWQAAVDACRSLMPGANETPAQSAARRAQLLKYSQCMRSHGITDFPDPDAQGHLAIRATPGGDLDPNSPTFKAAQGACSSLMPGRPGSGGMTVTAGGPQAGGPPPGAPSGGGGAVLAP